MILPFHFVGAQLEGTNHAPEKGLSHVIVIDAGALILDFLPPDWWKNKFLLVYKLMISPFGLNVV